MVPTFWTWVRTIRRYGRQVREYAMDMLGMCQCHGACVLDVGGKCRGVRETIKRISREYAGNVPASWCLLFGFGQGKFVSTGHN